MPRNTQGPQGNNVLNWPVVGREMMKKAGVDPDKPLDVNWKAVRDIRDNRDPQKIGAEILSQGNGAFGI